MFKYQLSAFADEASQVVLEQIAALKKNNVSLIELRGVDGTSVARLTDEQAKEARKKLDDAGIKLSSMGSPYGKYAIEKDFGEHRDFFRRGLEICKILGADQIRMFSFFMPEGCNPADWRNKVIDQLGLMLEDATAAGIKLLHENEKGIYGDIDDRCVDIMQVYGDKMGCIFDPANFIQSGVKPIEAFRKLEKWITYMHIKDAIMADGAVVPAGKGEGDIPTILDALGKKADKMILTLEPHLTVFEGLKGLQDEELTHHYTYPTPEAAFDAACDALKEVLAGIGYAETENGVWAK